MSEFEINENVKQSLKPLAIKMIDTEGLDIHKFNIEGTKITLYLMKTEASKEAFEQGLVISDEIFFEGPQSFVVLRSKPKDIKE